VLTPVDFYFPGSLMGIQPKIQKACGGDYDGDPVIVQTYSKESAIYQLIEL
jgi:hypothetical protein